MLQQTRVEVVKDYFTRWMKLFPSISALASADEVEVLHAWQGLGYYTRAKRLRSGAQFVRDHHGGVLPAGVDELLSIPGIGPYSAGAISSIAFGQKSPLVDGNVIRVLSRLFALAGDPNKMPLKRILWDVAGALVPENHPGDFNQALMELGALICTPKRPACHACPLRSECVAHKEGQTLRFPELPRPKKPTALSMVVVLARHRGALAVQTLPADARWWAGLDAFPFGEATEESQASVALRLAKEVGVPAIKKSRGASFTLLKPLSHSVTRYKISLQPILFDLSARRATDRFRWIKESQMSELALPSPHRKIARALFM